MFDQIDFGAVKTLVDVGAGEGTFLGPAIERYHPERWVAIDMLSDRVAALCKRFHDSIPPGMLYHCAVGERAEDGVPILRTGNIDSSSLLPINPQSGEWFEAGSEGMKQAPTGRVSVRRLDDILAHYEYDGIDLMKMDVQGYEGRAIRGGQEVLKCTRNLIIEILYVQHYFGQSMPDEIDAELVKLGFKFQGWAEEAWRNGILLQRDAWYART
jgi:FkbM family methyltransferase